MLTSKTWWYAAGVRAIKTFAQAVVGFIGGAAIFSDVSWATVASGAGLAAVLSILTSLSGLPEVTKE